MLASGELRRRTLTLMCDVHVSEKWFFVEKIEEKYYLLPDEDVDLYRSCKHKIHIEKIVFTAAVARPRRNPFTGEIWDGKIHLHSFIEYECAVRSSVNRPASTRITKPKSIKKPEYCDRIGVQKMLIFNRTMQHHTSS